MTVQQTDINCQLTWDCLHVLSSTLRHFPFKLQILCSARTNSSHKKKKQKGSMNFLPPKTNLHNSFPREPWMSICEPRAHFSGCLAMCALIIWWENVQTCSSCLENPLYYHRNKCWETVFWPSRCSHPTHCSLLGRWLTIV